MEQPQLSSMIALPDIASRVRERDRHIHLRNEHDRVLVVIRISDFRDPFPGIAHADPSRGQNTYLMRNDLALTFTP